MAIAPQGIESLQPNVMAGANKAVQSPDRKVLKILSSYFQNRGIPLDVGLNSVKKQLSEGLQLIDHENSVMAYKPIAKNTYQVHFFTVDNEKKLVKDIKFFVKELKKHGVRTVFDSEMDPVVIEALDKVGAKVLQSHLPQFKIEAKL
jgi:hypothetical protein